MRFTLVSASKKVLDVQADVVNLPAAGGLMEVLPGHEPFFAAVVPGVLRVTAGGETSSYAVGAGLLETDGTSVSLLADTIDSARDLAGDDLVARREAARKLVAQMTADGVADPDALVEAETALLRAEAQAALR